MRTYKCPACFLTFTEADRAWDIAIESGACPKCRESLRDFPAPLRQPPPKSIADTKKQVVAAIQTTPTQRFNFCPHCGARTVVGAGFCPQCGASVRPIEGPDKKNSAQVRPWVRYWARMFDLCLFGLPAGFLLVFLAPQVFSQKGTDSLLWILLLFAWIPIESLLLSAFGSTPGKWLFRIKLLYREGSEIPYSVALSRSSKVWWRGLGIGFPLISLITLAVAYRRLTRNSVTSWDREDKFVVSHERIGMPRVIGAVVFFLLYFFLIALGSVANA